MGITGNKGEWSELYALVELLHTGKLYAADENLQRIDEIYFPVLRVFRDMGKPEQIDFVIKDGDVDILVSGEKASTLPGS